MRHLHSYGPGLVVLGAAGFALLAGPMAVRTFTHAQTSVEIVEAANRLDDGSVLERINEANRDIARMVEPSVVHVSVVGEVRRRSASQPYVSSGSGWVYDEEGHVVTNAHVVDGASRVQVQLAGGDLREAEVVGLDLPTDIAVLKVDASNLHPARRGDSNELQQGDLVYAFGSPFDFRFSMSSGIVSGLGRSAGLNEILYQD
jgi:S1-C subfamily serine protease